MRDGRIDTMKVNIVAADHPVWHGEATSVTIPASEGGMGILPDHEPVLTVIKQGTIVVVDRMAIAAPSR